MNRSEGWHARRRKYIGSSDAAAICGVSPYSNAYDVYLQKLGSVSGFEGNEATMIGNRLEGPILDMYEARTGAGLDFRDFPIVPGDQIHDGPRWAAATLDALSGNRIVEVKTAGMVSRLFNSDWGDDGSGDIPVQYIMQAHHQMLTLGRNSDGIVDVPALIGGMGFRIYHVERDSEIIEAMRDRLEDFWQCVQSQTPPAGDPPSVETMKRLERVEGAVVDVPGELVEQWNEAKRRATAAKKEADELKRAVMHALGDAEFGDYGDPKKWIECKEQTRKAFTVSEKTFTTMALRKRPGA